MAKPYSVDLRIRVLADYDEGVRPAELADYPFPAANRRIIAALLERLDASVPAADPEP